jgi:general stress protein 26
MTEKQKDTPAAILDSLIDKFAVADTCWFSSTRPNGRPHLAPIGHVWHEGRAYVCTPSGSVRAANVAHNPHVSLSLPDPYNVFILEGVAAPAPEMEAALQPLFQAKYDWNISTDIKYDLILAITPRKIMAWGDHGEGRWYF